MSQDSRLDQDLSKQSIKRLVSQIDSSRFQAWYREREFARNIRDGKPYFNGASPVPNPERHSPSRLLSCHRKTYYQHHNAPKETPDPTGIFWFGSNFESEIAEPFLREVAGPDQYVQNSIWIDFTVETTAGELRFKGETDPVIVDNEGIPHLLTEIKTTTSFKNLDAPKPHHKAQTHVYLKGLSQKFDNDNQDAVIIYAKRDDLDFRAFHIKFDIEFWEEDVLQWASENTEYRRDGELPPAVPEFNWECEFCSFRVRCGQTDDPHTDIGPTGFLPLTEYPREHIETYLDAYPDAKLTPTLAQKYPDLATEHEVYNWTCQACSTTIPYGTTEWDGTASNLPQCPECGDEGIPVSMHGPQPEHQDPSEQTNLEASQ